MENALLVSCYENDTSLFTETLKLASITQITVLKTAGEARKILLGRDFDLVIVNSPLPDESGENFSRFIALKNISQVILAVKSEYLDAVSTACEETGVLVIPKPLNKALFRSALSMTKSVQSRIRLLENENAQLKTQIEDSRIIDRAKCLLISYLNMSEKEAHRFIEKQAMDMRTAKRVIAEGILKTYAN